MDQWLGTGQQESGWQAGPSVEAVVEEGPACCPSLGHRQEEGDPVRDQLWVQ